MAVAAVNRKPLGGMVLIKDISSKESSEVLSLDIWQSPQQLPIGKGNKL